MCIYVCIYAYIYIYILAAYTLALPGHNVNMKHYRNHSNFGLVGPIISFWQPKQIPVGVANATPHTLPHPYVVGNAHPVTSYALFQSN